MATISDIDGTLLNKGVQPIPKVIQFVETQSPPLYIITARPETDRTNTIVALQRAKVRYTRLMMANKGENPIDSKRRNATEVMNSNTVNVAVDNDPAIRSMYQSLGILKVIDPGSLK